MSNIHGINFENQVVTAKDHGRLFQCTLEDGILSGCDLSFSGTALRIAPGYFLIAGREMKLTANTNVTVDGASSGFARVLVCIDLTQAATSESFEQVDFSVEYAATATGFPVLTQEDVNGSGSIYQFALCVVTLASSGITSIDSSAGAAVVRIPLIDTAHLASSAVTTAKIASNAVTAGKLASAAVETAKLADGAVTQAKLASGSVTTEKIADGAVSIAKGGTGSSNGSTGLKNLLAAGPMVLSSNQYGSSLPATGVAGQIFFKKV